MKSCIPPDPELNWSASSKSYDQFRFALQRLANCSGHGYDMHIWSLSCVARLARESGLEPIEGVNNKTKRMNLRLHTGTWGTFSYAGL